MAQPGAIVVGVGAEVGLGAALCRRFARGGLHVLVAGRTQARVGGVAETIRRAGGSATAIATDTTREDQVIRLFDAAERELAAVPEFVRAKGEDGLLDIDVIAETYWQIHTQHPSAWTHEVDLRPFKEPF